MSEVLLSIRIPLAPKSKERPRVALRGGRARAYTPKETEAWEAAAEWHIRSAIGHRWVSVDVPVSVEMVAVAERCAERPKGVSLEAWKRGGRVHRVGRTDADNELKAGMDALSRAAFWTDDNLAVDVRAVKVWGAVGERACVEMIVRKIVAVAEENG